MWKALKEDASIYSCQLTLELVPGSMKKYFVYSWNNLAWSWLSTAVDYVPLPLYKDLPSEGGWWMDE